MGRRAVQALALLLGIAFGVHLADEWLMPLVPLLSVLGVLALIFVVVLGRRGR